MWALCFLPMVQALSLSPKLTWRERIKAQRHIRPHVNPLQRRFQEQPNLDAIAAQLDFADPSLPLHIDVGCGKGHFCADLAEARQDINVLGIEIREQLVDEAQRLCALSGVPNLKFIAGSANTLVGPCCDAFLPHGQLRSASVNFPDPWPKRAHRKRRVVQPDLVRALAERLKVEGADGDQGFVLVQSDVPELAEEMRATFLESGLFADNSKEETTVHAFGPMAIQTERERQAARRGIAVTRFCLARADS
jgi:tRNA (guanine-N7-)-methyltransferase